MTYKQLLGWVLGSSGSLAVLCLTIYQFHTSRPHEGAVRTEELEAIVKSIREEGKTRAEHVSVMMQLLREQLNEIKADLRTIKKEVQNVP